MRYENANDASEIIAADLVVDASGRGAPTLGLLKSMGRPLPEETTIGIDLGYGTCVFAVPDDAPTDWKGVMTFGQSRSCVQSSNEQLEKLCTSFFSAWCGQ